MAKIKILSDSKYPKTETYNKIKDFLSNSDDLKKLTPSYSCSFDDQKQCGKIKGSGFDADVKVHEGATTQAEIVVDLSLLLTPFKGKVEEVLKRKLTKLLS